MDENGNIDWKDTWCPDLDNGEQTLREVYDTFPGDEQAAIPLYIKLFENPNYITCLPGSIPIEEHDYLHIILGRGVYAQDEAFVIGFCFGTARETNNWHVKFFKWLGKYIYQGPKSFSDDDYKAFDIGFDFARSLPRKDIHKLNFDVLLDENIDYVRDLLGIDLNELEYYRRYEKIMLPNTKASNRL